MAALVALYENEAHMTLAAAALGVPQSSMSRRIRTLENQLQMPLLVREGRVVRLTPAAADLARRARHPLRELDVMVQALAGESDPDSGTVSFGFPLTMGSGRVPDLLGEFRRRHPGVRVQLKQAHGAQLEEDLLAGKLDLAMMIPAPTRAEHTVLASQQIVAVLPADHRLAAATGLRIEDLAEETFIANPASYHLRQVTEAWCHQAGFKPDIGLEVTEFATIRELISRGLGIALLPRDKRIPPGAVECPLAGHSYQREIALAWATSLAAPVTRQFLQFLAAGFEHGD